MAPSREITHTRIELYQIDPDTDLQQLASATGLDPAVQETLARLRGQQVAIVTLRTQPAAPILAGFAAVVLLASSVGVISGILFARARSAALGVSRDRALGAYAVVVGFTNIVYTALALVYAALVGAL